MEPRNGVRTLIILLFGICSLSAPALAETVLFSAGQGQISSVGVLSITQDLRGNLYFGTDNGLSFYDGTWNITHMTLGDTRWGLLSDQVEALAFDDQGQLWIGYPDGLQILEGNSFVTVDDQQMLKSLDIHELLRRDGEMWIASGNSGVHRYTDGVWRWFQPGGSEGFGCNYVTSMATDPATDTLYIACNEGIWFTNGTGDTVTFSPLVIPGLVPRSVEGIRTDPFGGIYIFNSSTVLHYSEDGGAVTTVAPGTFMGVFITDLGTDPDRTLWIATNYGIYAWENGVEEHLDASSGIMNNGVKKIYIDSDDRLWFVTPENVGYFTITRKTGGNGSPIPITVFSIPTVPSPGPTPIPSITPSLSFTEIQEVPTPAPSGPFANLLDTILGYFGQLFHR